MVGYDGYYSNKSRGLRKKAGADDQVTAVINSDILPKAFRKHWARLIQKIYIVNPLVCSKCSGPMRIISFIHEPEIIKKILKHLDLRDVKRKPPPCANGPPPYSFIIYDHFSAPSAVWEAIISLICGLASKAGLVKSVSIAPGATQLAVMPRSSNYPESSSSSVITTKGTKREWSYVLSSLVLIVFFVVI